MQNKFDSEYLKTYKTSYNIMRPIRKSLKRTTYLLPFNTSSIINMGFECYDKLHQLEKVFEKVYGYEINQASIDDAIDNGFNASNVSLQDITVPFVPKWKTELAICFYVFEHLTDLQIKMAIKNLINHSPINIFKITDIEDSNYIKDPTHINPKTPKDWSSFLVAEYKQYGFMKLKSPKYIYTFIEKNLYNQIETNYLLAVNSIYPKENKFI